MDVEGHRRQDHTLRSHPIPLSSGSRLDDRKSFPKMEEDTRDLLSYMNSWVDGEAVGFHRFSDRIPTFASLGFPAAFEGFSVESSAVTLSTAFHLVPAFPLRGAWMKMDGH